MKVHCLQASLLCILFMTNVANGQWIEKNNGFPFGGSIRTIYHCGGTNPLFAGTDGGGIYKSTDNGNSWTPVNNGLTELIINSISSADCSGTYYASTTNGLFKTIDSGENWTKLNTGQTGYVRLLYSFGSSVYISTFDYDNLLISNDEGGSWSNADDSAPLYLDGMINVLEGCCDNLYAWNDSEVYKSTDAGFSWSSLSTGLPASIRAVTILGTDLFAATTSGIYRSIDGGTSWNAVNNGLSALHGLAVWTANGLVFASVLNGSSFDLFVTSDNGSNWVPADSGLGNQRANSISNGQSDGSGKIFAGAAGGVFYSADNGLNWLPTINGLYANQIRSIARTDNALFAGMLGYTGSQAKGIYRSLDNGDTWEERNNGMPDSYVYCIINDGNTVYIGTSSSGIFASTDNGDSWQPKNNGLTNMVVFSLALFENQIYAGTNAGIFISTDNGESWSPSNNGLTNLVIRDLAVTATAVFAGTLSGGVFMSDNSGANWTAVNNGLTALQVRSLAVSGNTLFAGTVYNGIFRSTNNGSSWTSVNNGLNPAAFFFGLEAANSDIFAGGYYEAGESQLYRSTDNGDSWTEFSDANFHPNVFYLNTYGKTVYAATSGQGVWLKVLDPTVQPTTLTFSDVETTTLSGNFQVASDDPDGYVIFYSENVAPDFVPAYGVEYAYHQEVGSVAGNKIYNLGQGNSTDLNLNDLTPGTTLYFKIYSYNGSGSTTKYLTTSPLTGSVTTKSLQPQTIIFNPIPDQLLEESSLTLSATATSGLPVSFDLITGPATVSGNEVSFTGLGTVTIRANQGGNEQYLAAEPVARSFEVITVTGLEGKSTPIIMYPNPVTDVLTVQAADNSVFIKLFNSQGVEVMDVQPNTGNQVSHLANGIYILRVSGTHGHTFRKLLKK
ncbi:MAG: T9SS type A sorting domain-containing protein [Cyclobacteriaceae bacterium]